jgi:hypothetical protein
MLAQGKDDRADVLGYLFLKKEGIGAVCRDPCPALRLMLKSRARWQHANALICRALCWLLRTSVREIGPAVQDGASIFAQVGEIRVQ